MSTNRFFSLTQGDTWFTGDTLRKPLKDSAGPSPHVVVKLFKTITLSPAPPSILYTLLKLALP